MYLVHAALRPPTTGGPLPADARGLLVAAVRPEDRIEHLALHPRAVPHPVLGLFLLADSLEEAEIRAAAFCRRALAGASPLAEWTTDVVSAPFVAPFYERLLSSSDRPGLNGPGTLPST